MGYKSRGNWNVGACIKLCMNRGKRTCKKCVRFSRFKGYTDARGEWVSEKAYKRYIREIGLSLDQ